MKRHAAARPFTLIELIAVMGVLILLAATAIPAYSSLFSGRKTTLAANMVNGAVMEARAHAISSKCYTAIVFVKYKDAAGKDEDGFRGFRLAEVYHDPEASATSANYYWRRWVPGSSFVLLPDNTMIVDNSENLGTTDVDNATKGKNVLLKVKSLPTKSNDSSEIMPNGDDTARAIFFKPNGQLAKNKSGVTNEYNVVVRFVEINRYNTNKSKTPKLPLNINWLTCKTKFMDAVQ